MHCVDLGESFQTHIFLQNVASIQPRTSLLKFARCPYSDPPGTPSCHLSASRYRIARAAPSFRRGAHAKSTSDPVVSTVNIPPGRIGSLNGQVFVRASCEHGRCCRWARPCSASSCTASYAELNWLRRAGGAFSSPSLKQQSIFRCKNLTELSMNRFKGNNQCLL